MQKHESQQETLYQKIFAWAQMRAVFPEVLGRERFSVFSFMRDHLHGGCCVIMLGFPSLGLPLPYWAHAGNQLLVATFIASQNGWLCTEKLASPHLPDTVKLHEVWPLAGFYLLLLLSTGGMLFLTSAGDLVSKFFELEFQALVFM
jgi:hypothetical protein